MKVFKLVILLIVAYSCSENLGTSESGQFKILDTDDISGPLDYKKLSEVILGPKCMGCHIHSSWKDNEVAFLNYVEPGSPESSPAYLAVESGRMPKNGPELSDAEKRLVYDYIANLASTPSPTPVPIPAPAPDPTPSNPGDDDPVKITFKDIKERILKPKCMQCHSAWAGQEEELLKRVEPGSPETSMLYLRVENGEMPLGGPELTDDEKKLLFDYIINL